MAMDLSFQNELKEAEAEAEKAFERAQAEKSKEESNDEGPKVNVPEYVQFVKLISIEVMDQAVQAFFGINNVTVEDFEAKFGVDLEEYRNFYMEVGITDDLIGPVLVGKVSPILVLKQDNNGKFKALVMKHEGFINMEHGTAFIDSKTWDKFVDDTLMQEVEEALRKQLELKRQAEEAAARQAEEAAEDSET